MCTRSDERSATSTSPARCACGRGCFACDLAVEARKQNIDAGDVFLRGYLHGLHDGRLGHMCPGHQSRFDASRNNLDEADDPGALAVIGEVRDASAH